MEIIDSFVFQTFKISWINAISKVGYINIQKTTSETIDDFTEMWLLGNKIGQFLKKTENIKADDIAYHSLKTPINSANINIFPRYKGDYQENNDTYNIAESKTQPATSSKEVILPLFIQLKEFLQN